MLLRMLVITRLLMLSLVMVLGMTGCQDTALIPKEKAVQIARQAVNYDTVTRAEQKQGDKGPVWEVELLERPDGGLRSIVLIDARTGEVLKVSGGVRQG
jgi:uncharacterized membrane protein YkoI